MFVIMRRIGMVIGGLLALTVLAIVIIFFATEMRLNRRYNIQVEPVPIPTDADSIWEGQVRMVSSLCTDCHGKNLGGKIVVDDPAFGRIYARNLTRGRGGVGRIYTDADWVRAIRHGVRSDGKSMVISPAKHYYYMSDEDLGKVIAYVKSVPPVDNELPPASIGFWGRVILTLFNPPEWFPAEKIDHTAPRPTAPEPGVTVAYGEYLVQIGACLVCHRQGGASTLSAAPGGRQGDWSEADFITAMRTGITPDGDKLDNAEMPWQSIGQMPDEELKAMWLYLQTRPADGAGRMGRGQANESAP